MVNAYAGENSEHSASWAFNSAEIEKPKGCVHTLEVTAVDSIIQARL
jgi:hypothetical protein